MPSENYRFPGLIADAQGTVSGTTTDSMPIAVVLNSVVVKSTTGCLGRNHAVFASLTGGVVFNFNGNMIDCQDLDVPLGGLVLQANTPAKISFQVRGYNPGEQVDLEGVLHASFFGAPPVGAPLGTDTQLPGTPTRPPAAIPPAVATLVQGVSSMVTSPVGAFTDMMGDLMQQMPIVGNTGVFSLMRKDFLDMVTAINKLASEIKRNNDTKGR